MDFPLTVDSTLYIAAAPTVEAIVSTQFVHQIETAWGVNARGQTFGASKPGFGEPDLLAVESAEGNPGYVNASELGEANGMSESFDSPEDALEWQESTKGQRISIPMYESDGITVVGEIILQR
ncbi:hypothetical protein [Salinibacterium sp. ZJ450]|uniref:hypothetical protein n=1 Tax=Salinibacterium sp. ZJ450 TaxID=2708338 RepID=UPI00141E6BED|nr:hypothetical protein [Salinibacterium sp. ZJ450]